jgi:hypothetical protein
MDFGIVEHFGIRLANIVQPNISHDVALSLQSLCGIGQSCSLQEVQAHAARRKHDGEDRLPWPLGGAKANDQLVVIVVNYLDSARHELPHLRERTSGKSGNLGVVFREERIELLLSIGLRCASRGVLRFAVRRFPSRHTRAPDASVPEAPSSVEPASSRHYRSPTTISRAKPGNPKPAVTSSSTDPPNRSPSRTKAANSAASAPSGLRPGNTASSTARLASAAS